MPMRYGKLEIDTDLNEISGPLGRRRLEPQAMTVLALLCEQPGRAWSRDELLTRGWPGRVVSDATLSGAISRLRAGLKATGADVRIETISKRGYRLVLQRAPVWRLPARFVTRPLLAIGILAVLMVINTPAPPATDESAAGTDARFLRVDFDITRPSGERITPFVLLADGRSGELIIGDEEPLRIEVHVEPRDADIVFLRYDIASVSEWGRFEVTTPYGESTRFSMPAGEGGYRIAVSVEPAAIELVPAPLQEN